MSARPPAEWTETYNSSSDFIDPTKPQPVAVRDCNDGTAGAPTVTLHLRELLIRGVGDLVYFPTRRPVGTSGAVTLQVTAPGWYELQVASIDPSTSCWPIDATWGALGYGSR